MKFSRKHFVAGLIGNILVFAVGVVGIVMLLLEHYDLSKVFMYFTTLSNVLVILCSLVNAILYAVSIAKKKNCVKEGFQVLKLIAVVGVAITFTMVIVFLAPNNSTDFDLFAGSQLFLHVITPIVTALSFIFLEYQTKIRFRFFFFPVFFALLYGAFYVAYAFLAPAGEGIDWYGFMFEAGARVAPADPSKFTLGSFILFLAESLGGGVVFGLAFWLLNKIMNLIFIGYTVTEESEEEYYDEVDEAAAEEENKEEVEEAKEEAVEETKETPKKKTTSTTSKAKKAPATTSAPKKYKDSARVYHIARSKFVSRHWQVKLAGGEKAIKIFPTQAEAIAYAKELVKKQGGSIRIHSMKGQLRK